MNLAELVVPQGIILDLRVSSKKQALQEMAKHASQITQESERRIFEVLLVRERLGSTGVGNGIAIPHGKLENLKRLHLLFARLGEPIDFDAIDEQPVDLLCLLLAPPSSGADHLKALAQVSRLLRERSTCDKLRHASSADAVMALLVHHPTSHAA